MHSMPMSAKQKSVYVCSECGHQEAKWLGRCPGCGEWNTLLESSPTPGGKKKNTSKKDKLEALPLSEVKTGDRVFIDSGNDETNRVLGGGIVRGASILIGGEPGIGKSTLMLEIAGNAKGKGPVLYISGEESSEQIKMRSERIGINGKKISLLTDTSLERIESVLNSKNPEVIIIDSIQTLISREAGNVPGTVNQIKYCCYEIIQWAKEHNAAVFFVAHVTKEGSIAGPKVIEHLVDTVCYFEHTGNEVRILRSMKNRFGSVDEIGLFSMSEKGLVQVINPSSAFLVFREDSIPPGIAVASIYEGSRPFLVEIQALVVPAKGGISRIYADKIDSNRVSRVAAVLEKHIELRFSDQDIYVNVAGGIRIQEVGVELPLAVALYSARTGLAVPEKSVLSGELTLAGEIRPIAHRKRRETTAREMGFTRFIAPPERESTVRGGSGKSSVSGSNTAAKSTDGVYNIRDCVKLLFNSGKNAL